MKVKSFCVGLANGIEWAIEALDKFVSNLGNVQIHQVTDTLYTDTNTDFTFSRTIVRVITYSLL